MVKFSEPVLNRTFAALADPTRRALVMRLAQHPGLSVSELAQPFPVSLPAIMKHLDVLSDAGLIAAGIAVAIIAVVLGVGTNLNDVFGSVSSAMGTGG